MSNREKLAKIKEIIRQLVVKELEEASTTASAGAANPMGTGIYYDTPYAFTGKRKKDKKKKKKITHAAGMKPVKEIANQEISALQNVEKGLKKLQQDYIKITNIGDKTLRNRQYNDYYEYIIGAKEGIGKLIQTLKRKQTLGESKMRPAVKKLLKQKGYGPIFQAIDNSKRQFKQMRYSRGEIQDTLIDMFGSEDPKILQKINEGRYHDWRNDESMTPKQKIGRSMREIRDALNELDKTVKMNLKLKTELKMKSEADWKNTHKALTKISERLVKMANKVGNLK